MANKIVNKHIRKIGAIGDDFTRRLERTFNRLDASYSSLLGEVSKQEFIDVALARQQVEDLLINSGYYEDIGDLLNEGYQEAIDESFEQYQEMLGENFQFSEVSIGRLDGLKQMDFGSFKKLADDAAESLSRVMVDMQFGAITKNEAIKEMLGIVDNKLRRHVTTWINTGLNNYYTESNNKLASDNGIKKFQYLGPKDLKTRPFGMKYINQVKTIKEWDALATDPIRGKAPLPVSVWLTGWNHRGTLVGVN